MNSIENYDFQLKIEGHVVQMENKIESQVILVQTKNNRVGPSKEGSTSGSFNVNPFLSNLFLNTNDIQVIWSSVRVLKRTFSFKKQKKNSQ